MIRPSTKLRANGNYIDSIDHFPFVLRLSKHERIFSHTLSGLLASSVYATWSVRLCSVATFAIDRDMRLTEQGGTIMFTPIRTAKSCFAKMFILTPIVMALALAFVFAPATAE